MKHGILEEQKFTANKRRRIEKKTKPILNLYQSLHDGLHLTSQATFDPYKITKLTDQAWTLVPKQSHIKKILDTYSNQVLAIHGFSIEPYRGVKDEKFDNEDEIDSFIMSEENNIRKTVKQLPIFNSYAMVPDMKKPGRILHRDGSTTVAFTIQRKGELPLGCVYCTIDIGQKAQVISLGVSLQNKKLGSFLLEVAVIICALYGCSKIELESTPKAVPLYLRHGFTFQPGSNSLLDLLDCEEYFELDLTDEESLTILEKRINANFKLQPAIQEHLECYTSQNQAFQAILKNLETLRRMRQSKNPVIVQRAMDSINKYDETAFPRAFLEEMTRSRIKVNPFIRTPILNQPALHYGGQHREQMTFPRAIVKNKY